jgi:hypothetical protein
MFSADTPGTVFTNTNFSGSNQFSRLRMVSAEIAELGCGDQHETKEAGSIFIMRGPDKRDYENESDYMDDVNRWEDEADQERDRKRDDIAEFIADARMDEANDEREERNAAFERFIATIED